MTTLLIAGSRDATPIMLDYTLRVVERAYTLGWHIIVGDNPQGVDHAVITLARQLHMNLTVVGIDPQPRCGAVEHYIQVQLPADNLHNRDHYHQRDRYMVDCCDRAIFIWNGHSSGTKRGHDYCKGQGKPADLIQPHAA